MKKLSFIVLFCLSLKMVHSQIGTFKIKTDGHVLVGYNASGTSSIEHKAVCFGNSFATNANLNYGTWAISHWDNGLQFHKPCPSVNCGVYKFAIMDNGQVGINMKPKTSGSYNLSFKLWVNGNICIPAGGTYYGSDINLKKDITPITNSLTKVISLRPVSYHYRAEARFGDTIPGDTLIGDPNSPFNADSETKHFGFIAQELDSVYPDLVKLIGVDTRGINYTELIPILVNAMQDQQKIIEDLKAEVLLIKNLTPSSTTKSVLYQNDPNPFDANTTFKYYIDETISVTNCSIEVRDLTGILKATIPLADQSGLGQTSYSFANLNVGYYVYTLKVNGAAKDSKMFLIER